MLMPHLRVGRSPGEPHDPLPQMGTVGRVRIYGGSPGCLLLSLAATVLELF